MVCTTLHYSCGCRFGVSTQGIDDKKLEKKMKMLKLSRNDMGQDAAENRETIKGALEKAMGETIRGEVNLEDEEVKTNLKEKVKGLVSTQAPISGFGHDDASGAGDEAKSVSVDDSWDDDVPEKEAATAVEIKKATDKESPTFDNAPAETKGMPEQSEELSDAASSSSEADDYSEDDFEVENNNEEEPKPLSVDDSWGTAAKSPAAPPSTDKEEKDKAFKIEVDIKDEPKPLSVDDSWGDTPKSKSSVKAATPKAQSGTTAATAPTQTLHVSTTPQGSGFEKVEMLASPDSLVSEELGEDKKPPSSFIEEEEGNVKELDFSDDDDDLSADELP